MALKLLALSLSSFAVLANAHLAAFHKAMYCLNGTVVGQVDYNNNAPVNPLWMLSTNDWWFHHTNQCDQFPPAPGDFLELPAGGSFTVEIAGNRADTSLSYNGQYVTEWGDGKDHPEDYNDSNCITSPNMHTQNQSMAAGTAFAISYQSDLSKVTMENLVVFTVAYNTPWKLVTTYSVPKDLPACPTDGCTCAWVWIPNGCGEPNIYMEGLKCKVTGATSTVPLASAKPPVWCEDDQSKCTQGAKQILAWNQASGNNIEVSGNDLSGHPKSPGYNSKCGFSDGAQNNIFETSSSSAVEGDMIPAGGGTVSLTSSSTTSAGTYYTTTSTTAGGTVSLTSSSTTSAGTTYYTTTSTTAGGAGDCSMPPSDSTSAPPSTASFNSSSTASADTTYYTTTSATGVADGCSMSPSNSTSAPASTASSDSSYTTTDTTEYMTSTLYPSSSAFSIPFSIAPSDLSSKFITPTVPSRTASPSGSETCRPPKPKRMVHKRSRHP